MKLILTDAEAVKKVQSIKAVRSATGFGLKEAKEKVDDFLASRGVVRNPEVVLQTGLPRPDAERALAVLQAEGYAEGRIEGDDFDASLLENALALLDVIERARETNDPASKIIRDFLGANSAS